MDNKYILSYIQTLVWKYAMSQELPWFGNQLINHPPLGFNIGYTRNIPCCGFDNEPQLFCPLDGWIEMKELNELTWTTWNQWKTWMNRNEWIETVKGCAQPLRCTRHMSRGSLDMWLCSLVWVGRENLNVNEWIDMKESKRMNWHDWVEMNKWMNWHE